MTTLQWLDGTDGHFVATFGGGAAGAMYECAFGVEEIVGASPTQEAPVTLLAESHSAKFILSGSAAGVVRLQPTAAVGDGRQWMSSSRRPKYWEHTVRSAKVGESGEKGILGWEMSSRLCFTTPAQSLSHDCSPYRGLTRTPRNCGRCSSFKGPFSVAPCKTLFVLLATFTSLYTGGVCSHVTHRPRLSHSQVHVSHTGAVSGVAMSFDDRYCLTTGRDG